MLRDHDFPDLTAVASATCRNGCGVIARRVKYVVGIGEIEFFHGIRRTDSRPSDVEGIWSPTNLPCAPKEEGSNVA